MCLLLKRTQTVYLLFSFLIVMMVIPLHDDCYFSDVDADAYVFISLSSDRRSIWNLLEQLTIFILWTGQSHTPSV